MSNPHQRLGMIVPFDMALDREYWTMLPDSASLHVTRMGIVDLPYGSDHAREVAKPAGVAAATATLVRIQPSVIAFGCTSASFVDGLAGEARIRRSIEEVGVPVAVTPSGALVEALQAIGAKRVGIGTPYGAELGDRLGDFLREAGFEPVSLVHLGYTDEEDVVAASSDIVVDLADRAMTTDADAVFLACTNLPTVAILPELRQRLGVPVLSANHVLMWDAMRRIGLASDDPLAVGGGNA